MPRPSHRYTAADIRNYLAGTMSPAEMHALEKAALDDAFLAEAIEGYQLEKETKTSFTDIRAKLQERLSVQTAKVVELPAARDKFPIRSVAAIAILILACAVFYFIVREQEASPKEDQQIASNKPRESSQVPVTDTAVVNFNDQPSVKTKAVATDRQSANKVESRSENPETEIPETSFKSESPTVTETTSIASNIKEVKPTDSTSDKRADIAMLQPTQNRTATPTQASYKLASSEVSIEQINKQFSAQVLAPDNTPLPFVRVNILNNHIATYTDKRGNFRIVSADSVVQLEVKSVGYLPKYIELKRGSSSHIVLEEDNLAMNSKVEVTTGTSSKQQGVRGRIIRDSAQTVEPEDGWDLYGYYVDNNIELPADVVNNKIKGTVEISFEVKRNGNIAKAKVEKSLCNDCDEEALRLLKQGPHWKQKKGKRTRSKVKVQF